MTEELKPCPFCGGEATIRREDDMWVVGCENHGWSDYDDDGCRLAGDVSLYVEINGTLNYWTFEITYLQKDIDAAKSKAIEAWNRRAERTWHDFADELPPSGASVLCRGRNGALYVGKPVTFKGNGTRKVWVPRGDQYRTPEKWMEIEDAD